VVQAEITKSIRLGNVHQLKQLLVANEVSVNQILPDFFSDQLNLMPLLTQAIHYDRKNIFDYLMLHHPLLNIKEALSLDPFYHAVTHGFFTHHNRYYADVLIEHGAEGSVRSSKYEKGEDVFMAMILFHGSYSHETPGFEQFFIDMLHGCVSNGYDVDDSYYSDGTLVEQGINSTPLIHSTLLDCSEKMKDANGCMAYLESYIDFYSNRKKDEFIKAHLQYIMRNHIAEDLSSWSEKQIEIYQDIKRMAIAEMAGDSNPVVGTQKKNSPRL